MRWKVSKFRAGALVEVRSEEEILATLDEHGCVEGLPFMPEMLMFCGRAFHVRAVAHKTCETARRTWQGRRLRETVHLADLRCDGSAHGGCQATCTLFWKDVWLKSGGGEVRPDQIVAVARSTTAWSKARLLADTQSCPNAPEDERRYSCQATSLYDATEPLAWWDPRQYVFDVLTGNHSATRVVRGLWLAALRAFLRRTPLGWRAVKWFQDWNHVWLTGRLPPSVRGKVIPGVRTPVSGINLRVGETVRIKSQAEIEETLDKHGKNRGLNFDANEMAQYCGRVVKVQGIVTKIIDEWTGQMLHMKQPGIVLEGVVCRAEHSPCRLNCPREIPSYWREIWLERVKESDRS